MSQNDPCIKASNLFKKGDIKGAKTKITTCIKQLEKQIRDFRKDINKQTMVKLRLSQVLWLEGQIHIHLNNINNAKASFIKCRNFVNGFPETNELLEFKGQIDYTLSQIEIHMGNIEEAIKLLINSQDCYNKASKHIKQIDSLYRLKEIYQELNQGNLALQCLDKIEKLIKKVNKTERKYLQARIELDRGKIIVNSDKFKAENYFKSARQKFSKLNNEKGEAESMLQLAILYDELEKHDSEELLLNALELAKLKEEVQLQSTIMIQIGLSLLKSGKFTEGKEKLIEGLELKTATGDEVGAARALIELARISLITARNEDDLLTARKFGERAYKIYDEKKMIILKANSLDMLGTINTKLGNYNIALSQLNDAKKIYRKQGDKISEAKMLLQQAIAFDLQNSPTEAIDALIRAEKIFEKGNDKQGLAETWQLLGIFEGRREKQLGLAYLKKSKTLYQEIIKNNKNLYPIIEVIDKHIEELNVD